MFCSVTGKYKVFTLIFFGLIKSSHFTFRHDGMLNFFLSLSIIKYMLTKCAS